MRIAPTTPSIITLGHAASALKTRPEALNPNAPLSRAVGGLLRSHNDPSVADLQLQTAVKVGRRLDIRI